MNIPPGMETRYSKEKIYFGGGNVEITNIAVNDEGMYDCMMKGFGITTESTKKFDIKVFAAPKVNAYKVQDSLRTGDEAVVAAKCEALNGKSI